jgi:SAM-dependent methyltransferase
MFFDTPLKYRIWYKLLILAIVAIMGWLVLRRWWENTVSWDKEGFTDAELSLSLLHAQNGEKYKLVTKPYEDPYYVNVYDKLHLPHRHIPDEIDWILATTQATPETALIVDVGSGTGTGLAALLQRGFTNSYGVDSSQVMLDKAAKKYPEVAGQCTKADVVNDPMLFERGTCSHILCLDKTIYDISDKRAFFRHCYGWLKPGGVLALHLVEPDKYNPQPLLSYKNSIFADEATRHADKPVHLPENVVCRTKPLADGIFTETFTDDSAAVVRRVERTMYMESPDEIVGLAQRCGFIPTAAKTDRPFVVRVCPDDPHQQIVLLERAL